MRRLMKLAIQCAFCIFILVVPAEGQQVGSVDLTHPPVADNFKERQEKRILPNGCQKPSRGFADGGYPIGKTPPHEITVEVASMSNMEIAPGDVMQAEVRLRNNGTDPIKIPWSTDPNTADRNQNPNHLSWETGSFNILLDRDELKSVSQSLYGSKFSKGSILTIRPSEWITATVKFRLELEYPFPEQVFRTGKRQLRVEWEQSSQTEAFIRDKCELWSRYFTYGNFYQQQKPAIAITIARDRSRVH
jgi:hypothetical protein